jgi:ABC-type Mn2+/Zn2+ transport system permease subunit
MELIDFIADPWRSGIERRAIVEVVLLGGICGALSFWVSSYRLSYPAESLAHGLLPGLVLAALAGVPLLLGAGAGVAVAAGLVALAGRDERIGSDTATAVVVSGMFGLGGLLALSPDAPARLGELLFGDPLGVTDADLVAAAVLTVLGGAVLTAMHRPLTAVAFDPAGAAAAGVRPAWVRLGLLFLLAAALAVAVQGLGSLLVLAVLVAPAVAVRGRARSPRAAMLAGSAVAALAGMVGLYASHHLGSAAGASVALALCAAALGSFRRPSAPARRAAAGSGPLPAPPSPG